MDRVWNNDDLVSSLSRLGQLSAILVRVHPRVPGSYEVIFGNRRLAAARKLGWETIEAKVIESTDFQSLVMAFAENSDRKDFSDYEKALVIEELHNSTGKSYKEIADQIGRSPAFVSLHVAMLHLFPDEVGTREERTRLLHSMTENHARVLNRISDPLERWNTAKLAIRANLSARELAKFCARSRNRRSTKDLDENGNSVREVIWKAVNGLNLRNPLVFYGSAAKDFTMFSRFPPLSLMDNTKAEEHTSNLLRLQKEYDVKIEHLDVRIFGKFAYAAVVRVDKFKTRGRTFKMTTRGTIVLAKIENWRILHEHWSPGDHEGLDLFQTEEERLPEMSTP
jgi:ParB family transcriptional regulator, chromosome partitioning protein